jgi:hypothetical protein
LESSTFSCNPRSCAHNGLKKCANPRPVPPPPNTALPLPPLKRLSSMPLSIQSLHRSLQPALTPLLRRVNPQRRTYPPAKPHCTGRPPLSSRDVTETLRRPVSLRRSATESPGGCGAPPLRPNEVLKSTLSTRGAHAQCWREGTPRRASRPESFSSAERRRAWTNTVCTDQSQRMQTKWDPRDYGGQPKWGWRDYGGVPAAR